MNLKSVVGILRDPRSLPMRLNSPAMVSPARAACQLVRGLTLDQVETLRLELLGNHDLYDQLSRPLFDVRKLRFDTRRWNEFVYFIVRATAPNTMVETGVFDGRSTVVVLEAMRRNGAGRLISIDLPATRAIPCSTTRMLHSALPPGRDPGWLIPDYLRERHTLHLGDAAALLPKVLAGFESIDIFQHDSLHTYEHMKMEFGLAWPKIRKGGFLLSDDVTWNRAFYEHAKSVGLPYVITDSFGAIYKSAA